MLLTLPSRSYHFVLQSRHSIAAPPAIVNAVLDALAPLGITTIDMPLTPEKVWALVQAARLGKRGKLGRYRVLGKDHPALPLHFLHANKPTTSRSGQDDDQCTMAVAESARKEKVYPILLPLA